MGSCPSWGRLAPEILAGTWPFCRHLLPPSVPQNAIVTETGESQEAPWTEGGEVKVLAGQMGPGHDRSWGRRHHPPPHTNTRETQL